jgi:hypothetical protein
LKLCGECTDLVLFVRKTITTLGTEGVIAKVAKALDIDVDSLTRHIELGTAVGELIAQRAPSADRTPRTPNGRIDYDALAGHYERIQSRTTNKASIESNQTIQAELETSKRKRKRAEAAGITGEPRVSKLKDLEISKK